MTTIYDLIIAIDNHKTNSAWNKGVKRYANSLLNHMLYEYGGSFPMTHGDLDLLKNGADTWLQYSEGGCSLIYNRDIAYRLCNPTELKRTHYGEKNPNKNETWLQCQARALYQAEMLIDSYIF